MRTTTKGTAERSKKAGGSKEPAAKVSSKPTVKKAAASKAPSKRTATKAATAKPKKVSSKKAEAKKVRVKLSCSVLKLTLGIAGCEGCRCQSEGRYEGPCFKDKNQACLQDKACDDASGEDEGVRPSLTT